MGSKKKSSKNHYGGATKHQTSSGNNSKVGNPVGNNAVILKKLSISEEQLTQITTVETISKISRAGLTGARPMLESVSACLELTKQLPRGLVSTPKTTAERADAFVALSSWLKENGTDVAGKVRFAYEPDVGFGVFCEQDFTENEQVFKVPRELMLTVQDVDTRTDALGVMVQTNPLAQSMATITLALYLLHEALKGRESRFHPYIESLPRSFQNLPLYWGAEQLRLLQDTAAEQAGPQRVLNCFAYYSFLQAWLVRQPVDERAFSIDQFTFEDFRWALAVAMTRQNPVPRFNFDDDEEAQEGKSNQAEAVEENEEEEDSVPETDKEEESRLFLGERDLGLIPVFDMCNHEAGTYASAFDQTNLTIQSHAMRDFKKGEQFKIYYGLRPNVQFVVYQGFCMVPGENLNDVLEVSMGLLPADPLAKIKAKLVEQLGIAINDAKTHYFLTVSQANPLSVKCMDFARVAVMNKDECAAALRCAGAAAVSNVSDRLGLGSVTPDHDLRALEYLQKSFEDLVAPQEAEDEAGSKSHELTHRPAFELVSRLRECETYVANVVIKACMEKIMEFTTAKLEEAHVDDIVTSVD